MEISNPEKLASKRSSAPNYPTGSDQFIESEIVALIKIIESEKKSFDIQ
ncbi:MAG: hypothetical protein H0X62_10845 [Bacteroidetes bacterium]|nr:hypothetical protein [Bacteroidota bacterium]